MTVSAATGTTRTTPAIITLCDASWSLNRGQLAAQGTAMGRIDTRVGKLEALQPDRQRRLVILFAATGETGADCIRRHGHDPDDETKQYVVVQWGREARQEPR